MTRRKLTHSKPLLQVALVAPCAIAPGIWDESKLVIVREIRARSNIVVTA